MVRKLKHTTYKVPAQGHLQGLTHDNEKAFFSHFSLIDILAEIQSIFRYIVCLQYHISHSDGIHMSLEMYLKPKKVKHTQIEI